MAIHALCVLQALPVFSQSFGQWWWQASVRAEQRQTENRQDGTELRRFSLTGLRLTAELNGFIVHPAVGSFRLGVDTLFSDFEDGRLAESESLGGNFELNLLPRGKYPVRLFASRSEFDYTVPEGADPFFTLIRDPARQDRWGGAVRVARGALRGVQVSAESLRTDYLDPDARQGRHDTQAFQWSRASGAFRHHFRLARRRQIFGTQDLDRENLAAYLDEKGVLGKNWTWLFNGSGVQRSIRTGVVERDIDDYGVFGRFYRPVRDEDRLEFSAEADVTRLDANDPIQRYGALARYRRQQTERLQVGPFVRFVQQEFGSGSLSSSRAGLWVNWADKTRAVDKVFTLTSSFGSLSQSGFGDDRRQSNLNVYFTGTVGHGDLGRLRKEYEVDLARNELSSQRSATSLDPQNFELVRAVGEQDLARARMTLTRRLDSRSSSLWLDWTRLDARDALLGGDFTSDALTANGSRATARFDAQANVGSTRVKREMLSSEEIRFVGASAGWRPRRGLDLRALYRQDRQTSLLVPTLDGHLAEIRMTVRVGLLELDARIFESERRVDGGPTRENRGFSWSLRRRAAGLLPIISAPERTGVIR
ncbi:MAG: hypothetical protein OEM62_05405 [Acidobacteriota bacterium]|nr:hypothetical protein [Acidobacteriota bacterium]